MRSPSLFAVKLDFPMNPSLFESLLCVVSEERRQRVKRFLRHEDACRSVVGEALARRCIGQREKVSPQSISFTYNEHGKPGLALPCTIHFNVSHSGKWVVCAVDDRPIGADVERIHDVDDDISKRFLPGTAGGSTMRNTLSSSCPTRFPRVWMWTGP